MANTRSAAKAARQNQMRKKRNVARMTKCKTYLKKLKLYLTNPESNNTTALEMLKECQSNLHMAVNKNIIKPNNAARKISKIHHALKNKFANPA